jgi:hypothetical protein
MLVKGDTTTWKRYRANEQKFKGNSENNKT